MVALSAAGGGDVEVPPTLRALLAARLDQLDEPERTVLERGAVEGELFHRGAVQALAPGETEVTPRLAALVRRGLVRPDRPVLPGEDAYRFRHLLIRDATYEALPKANRAELHQRFAAWLQEHGQSLVELDEILGYHLEQACRYRVDLGLHVEGELRESARRHLTDAGRRALSRQDYVAASQLVRRALALVPEDEVDVPLEIDLAEALWNAGKTEEAYQSLGLLAERAAAVGDPVGEICSRLEQAVIRLKFEPHGSVRQLERLTEEATPTLEAAEDQFALYLLHFARSLVALNLLHYDAQISALEQASHYASLAGLGHLAPGLVRYESMARCYGSAPLSQLLTWLEERETTSGRDWPLTHWRAVALGMLGRFDEARPILAEFLRILEDRGDLVNLGLFRSQSASSLELLAGDAGAAARYAEEGCKLLEEVGEQGYLSGSCCNLGQALYALDRLDEAEARAQEGQRTGRQRRPGYPTQCRVRCKRKYSHGADHHGEAETLAREAVTLVDSTDTLVGQGDALYDLAEVLELAGRREEATGCAARGARALRTQRSGRARSPRPRTAGRASTSEIGEDPRCGHPATQKRVVRTGVLHRPRRYLGPSSSTSSVRRVTRIVRLVEVIDRVRELPVSSRYLGPSCSTCSVLPVTGVAPPLPANAGVAAMSITAVSATVASLLWVMVAPRDEG